MDTEVEPALIVHRKNGSTIKFVEYKSGLHYYDTLKSNGNSTNKSLTDYCFVITVAKNKSVFHKTRNTKSRPSM